MRVLVCGDKHLKISRFTQSVQLLKWVEDLCFKEKVDMYVCLGDDMDSHAVLRSEIISEFRKHIDSIRKQIPVVYVLGNHDYYKPRDSTYHSMQALEGLNNFTIIDSLKVIQDITFIPFMPDANNFPTKITTPMAMAHQTFLGSDFGHERPKDGVDVAKYKDVLFVSGHIHKRQEFENVYYPGTPLASSVDDVDQLKGVTIIDTVTLQKTFIQSPFPMWKSLEYKIDEFNSFDQLTEWLKSSLDDVNYWILKLEGPRIEVANYLKSKEYLGAIKDKKYGLRFTPTDAVKSSIRIKATSMTDVLTEYVNKVYVGSIDKSQILDEAKSIVATTLV